MKHTEGKQKKCNKHGYYWVGVCVDGQIAGDICPGCLIAAAPNLLDACKIVSGRFSKIATDGGTLQDFLDAGSFGEIMAAITSAESEG